MSRESRVCPLCSGTMQFRLGEYVCDGCQYRAPIELPKAEEMASREDETKSRRHRLIRPPSSTAGDDRPVFSPQDIDTTARVRFKESKPPPENGLQKGIVVSLLLLMGVVGILMFMPQQEAYVFAHGQSMVVGMFLSLVVGILLWAWALFTKNLVVKYVFIVLSGLNIISLVASVILLIYASYSRIVGTPMELAPYLGVVFYVVLGSALWIHAWIFYLLYSDINAMSVN